MGKFDSKAKARGATATLTSPVQATGADAISYEGATAYSRDAKSDLFMLAVVNMVGEDSFYEKAGDRDRRFRDLVRQVTKEDPDWIRRLIPWLRNEANMRSASIVAAVEYAKAGGPLPRGVIASAVSRADEPAEILAYAQTMGYKVSGGLKRGVADAVDKVYNEYSSMKYDGQSRAFRMADVIDLVHPQPVAPWKSDLYKYLLDKRHNRADLQVPDSLKMIFQRTKLEEIPVADRRKALREMSPQTLKDAGMTWEAISGWIQGPMDAEVWEKIAPSMGYMALLRNLRNFDEAGISPAARKAVAERLSDPEQVARSRQFPYRFWSAYQAAPSLAWGQALDEALTHSVQNIPALSGKTLILVDTSASMTSTYSERSKVSPVHSAAIFGVALAKAGQDVDLVGFANSTFTHKIPKGGSLLKEVERFVNRVGEVGHGTEMHRALKTHFKRGVHQRVVVISDMQTFGSSWGGSALDPADTLVPANIPIYGFNLGGYANTQVGTGKDNRHEFGGMNDQTFKMIGLLEARQSATWPF